MDQDQFTAYLAMQGLADQTLRNYRAMFARWCDYAITHDRNPMQPDPLTARAFATTLTGGRSIRAHARATIHHLCSALQVDDVSPAIPLPRQPRQSKAAIPHDQAVNLAQTALGSGLKGLAVLVGLYTAARRSEIASLCWRRIDFETRTVTLERPKTRDLHTVPLHSQLAAVLEPRRVPGDMWVFPGRWGGHVAPGTISAWVEDVAADAGLRISSHMLRRVALTQINEVTEDLRAAQQFAGHTDPAVTSVYTRASERRMDAAIESLDWLAS